MVLVLLGREEKDAEHHLAESVASDLVLAEFRPTRVPCSKRLKVLVQVGSASRGIDLPATGGLDQQVGTLHAQWLVRDHEILSYLDPGGASVGLDSSDHTRTSL